VDYNIREVYEKYQLAIIFSCVRILFNEYKHAVPASSYASFTTGIRPGRTALMDL
jgi:hypothetical protein